VVDVSTKLSSCPEIESLATLKVFRLAVVVTDMSSARAADVKVRQETGAVLNPSLGRCLQIASL